MSRFFVGQRVRVVNAGANYYDDPIQFGSEAVIISTSFVYDAPRTDWRIKLENGDVFAIAERFLEPILPEGHQPAELTIDELLPFLKNREVV